MIKAIWVFVVAVAGLLSGTALAAPLDDAKAAFSRGDYAQSIELARPLAETGDIDAQLLLGTQYMVGFGVQKDPVEALAWYTRAADQGSADAMRGAGMVYLGFKDPVKAAEWFARGDAAGDLDSSLSLGLLYRYGSGVPLDAAKAASLFAKGAEAGDLDGQRNLAQLYYEGNGVPEDREEAARLFALAAEQNDPDSQNDLAIMLSEGDHVAKDYVESGKWALLAATQGHRNAKVFVGKLELVLSDEQRAAAEARANEWLAAYRAKHPG